MSGERLLLSGQNILVISPQRWGAMHVSKHHYAAELARMGNRVYFLNPPTFDPGPPVEIVPHDSIENLTLVTYRLFFPYNLRFHLRCLYDLLMSWQVKRVLKRIPVSFDIAWCFDTNLFADLRVFDAKKIIYHVVDQIMNDAGVKAAASADLIVAVDQLLLGKLSGVHVPQTVVGHGLAEPFVRMALLGQNKEVTETPGSGAINVGYIGNLMISSLDRSTLRKIIEGNPDVAFHFWGAFKPAESNVGADASPDVFTFVEFLKSSGNVYLHGARPPEKLAVEVQCIDVFLICYDVARDINGGCNSHKILEYLSTGKAVVSNTMSSYNDKTHLVYMCKNSDNSDMEVIFKSVISDLESHNGKHKRDERINLALMSSYEANVVKILNKLFVGARPAGQS